MNPLRWVGLVAIVAGTSRCASADLTPKPTPTVTPTEDPGTVVVDDAGAPGTDAAAAGADGAPTRLACTSTFGHALTTAHGRLDGYLVSIVPASTRTCNGDTQHVHLQVKVSGDVYDVAVNVDGLEAEVDAALPGPAWSEGWHPGEQLDYVADLGLHAPSFTLSGLTAVRQRVEAAAAQANHVAIYATGYGQDGVHLVHRQGSGNDGALVLDPLGPKPHVLAFRFDTQSF